MVVELCTACKLVTDPASTLVSVDFGFRICRLAFSVTSACTHPSVSVVYAATSSILESTQRKGERAEAATDVG